MGWGPKWTDLPPTATLHQYTSVNVWNQKFLKRNKSLKGYSFESGLFILKLKGDKKLRIYKKVLLTSSQPPKARGNIYLVMIWCQRKLKGGYKKTSEQAEMPSSKTSVHPT